MKVVLFCGGMGMRMRPLGGSGGGYGEDLPKPMVHVGGQRPLIWHVMKYYAHYGHKDFILCLGYRAEVIKNYFLTYNEYLTNDFVMRGGGSKIDLVHSDIADWNISFVDTGLSAKVGERLYAVRDYLKDDEMFLANYSDGLSDLPMGPYMDAFQKSGAVAGFAAVRPPQSSHVVRLNPDGAVTSIDPIGTSEVWINGGYFILRREIFDYMKKGEELVHEPFHRLIGEKKLYGHRYEGFWTCVDTFKEKQELDDMFAKGNTPWQVWKDQQQRIAHV